MSPHTAIFEFNLCSLKLEERTMAWMGIPGGSDNREFACNTGGLGSMSRSGRSPGEGNPLQYSFLEKSMDREAWRATAGGHKELDPTE